MNLFFSDTATKDQDLTESVVEDLNHDITSPVRSFLEKSKQQVEKYWKSMLNDVDEDEVAEAEAAEVKQRHLESVFLRTVFNDEGQEDHDEEDDEDDAAAAVLKATAGGGGGSGGGAAAAFSKLEDFLNPDNAAIKKLVEHRVLKNPTVLSELLDVKFSDLLKAFQNIMAGVKASSVEAAYLHLLQLVEDEGAPGISRLAAGLETGNGNDKDNDELVHAFPSPGGEGTNQFKYKMMAKDDTPMLQRKIIQEKTLDQNLPLTDLTAEGLHKALKQMSSDGSNHQVLPPKELQQQTFDGSNGKDEL